MRGLPALFRHRVTYWAVRAWRRGECRMPLWALATAAEECRKRAAALIHAADLCEAEIRKRQQEAREC